MSGDVPAEESEKTSQLGLARTSLVFGILSIPLAFVFVPGLIAILTGVRARRRLLKWPDTRIGATMAFCGMMLGGLSFVIGAMVIFKLPTGNPHDMATAQSLAVATAIQSAVNNIHLEYGQIPDVGDRVTTDSAKGVELLNVLLGIEGESAKSLNTRDIKFLSVREGKNRKNGLIYTSSGNPVEGLHDSWGNPYTVFLDNDDDQQLQFKIAGKSIHLKGRRVAVASPGADQELGTSDDVRTW